MPKKEVFIEGSIGPIEAMLHEVTSPCGIGVICHPNPQQEGTMDNKVVTTVTRAFNAMGITAIRFNYRGVGRSVGSFGNVQGELEDAISVIAHMRENWPGLDLWLAGFSFGAYIAAAASAQYETRQLISIAPAVDRMPFSNLARIACPWLIIQGDSDEIVDPDLVYTWYEQLDANKTLVKFPDTGHFFHGKLIELQQAIEFLKE